LKSDTKVPTTVDFLRRFHSNKQALNFSIISSVFPTSAYW